MGKKDGDWAAWATIEKPRQSLQLAGVRNVGPINGLKYNTSKINYKNKLSCNLSKCAALQL